MPYPPVEPERTLRPLAERKRLAAERRETQAATMRAEADELDRQWAEHMARRKAEEQAAS
jgi:hypothetical protein